MPQHVSQNHVPFWRTFFYGLGNAAGLLTYWTFNSYVQYFYTTVMGVSPEWVGRGWFAFGFWNAVNDPIAGWLSDRTRTRWGRRRFFIGLLAIPTAVAFALVWLPPFEKGNTAALMVYFLVVISIYDMLQSIVTLNQDALFPEMYQDTHERANGASIRQLVGFVAGTGMAVALTPTIYEELGWDALAILWGSIAVLMYFLSLKGIQEGVVLVASDERPLSWREQMRVVMTNRTFLIVLGINFVTRFILAVLLAILPFYADYVLEIEGEQLSQLVSALLVASGISLLAWQAIIKRLGTRLSMILSMAFAGLFAIPLLFMSSLSATAAVLALLGVAMGGTVLGPDMLFAEVVDEDYVRTGQRREGMYRGILGFIFRFPPAVAGLILGEGLALAGYNADLEVAAQPAAVTDVIRTFAATLPLMAMLLGLLLLYVYPMRGTYLKYVQTRAAEMRRITAIRQEGAGEQRSECMDDEKTQAL